MIDFDRFDAILLDLDGTIYHEEQVIDGAVELVRRLQREGRRYACLSNSTNSPMRIQRRLGRMGLAIDSEHIYTAAAAAADYLLEKYQRPRVFNLATEGVHDLLEGKAAWVQNGEEACDAVIVGAPANLYAGPQRQLAALDLLRAGAELVGICADRVFPSPRGVDFGSGPLTYLLGYAANVEPVFCGKPEPLFFHELCHRLGVEPGRCVLIGDNLETDVAGGKRVGMKTVLTLTGVSRREDLERLGEEAHPDWVVGSLLSLL
jgi:4-nitrophenyl phosphatase